jgi:Glycosyl Hydrolase Family 88.
MKKILLLGTSLLYTTFILAIEILFQKSEVKSIIRKVADWQIANPHPAPEHDDLNWPQGVLYAGMVDWAELVEKEDGDDTYYEWLIHIGQRICWLPDKRFYHADDITVSQSFLDLYRRYKDEAMIVSTLARAKWIVNHPSEGNFKLVEGDLRTLER